MPAANWAATSSKAGIAEWTIHQKLLLSQVNYWSKRVDVVIVYMHWGIQGSSTPSPVQLKVMKALSAAGADIVVGTHPHVLQGAGFYGSTLVGYSTGNFVWYTSAGRPTGVLEVKVSHGKAVSYNWVPAVYNSVGLPHPVTGSAKTSALANLDSLRVRAGLKKSSS
jgi:poly-gamma-glutamate synthesis protein (capsule biosynthesis protein)